MVVTIGPEEHVKATKTLEITEVMSYRSGRLVDARKFIERSTYGRFVRVRRILKETLHRDQKRIVCAMCLTPVYLVAKTEKRFFFRHSRENGNCPAVTRSKVSEGDIKAMKYYGQRESPAHRKTKELIERSLRVDAAFSDILVEKRWSSEASPASYRQPDVQARFGETRVAFEVQLSTTFLHVVVGRREFYRGEKAMLIWVLRRFDPEDRRLTVDDLFFSNNSNILVVDEETVALSEAEAAFVARCWYWEPYLEGGEVKHHWSTDLIKVRDMTFDVSNQRAFSFDVEARRRALHVELAKQAEDARLEYYKEARGTFFAFCEGWQNQRNFEDLEDEYADAIQPLIALGVAMPENATSALVFMRLVLILRSIELGHPVGYRFEKLVQVLHTVAESHRDLLYYVGHALNRYGRNELIAAQDAHRRWAARTDAIKKGMKARIPEYAPYPEWTETYRILFPAMADIPLWATTAS